MGVGVGVGWVAGMEGGGVDVSERLKVRDMVCLMGAAVTVAAGGTGAVRGCVGCPLLSTLLYH